MIFAGIIMVVVGLLFYFYNDKLGWLGKLPGDLRYKKDNFSIYAPFTTMIILSLIASVLLRFFRKFF